MGFNWGARKMSMHDKYNVTSFVPKVLRPRPRENFQELAACAVSLCFTYNVGGRQHPDRAGIHPRKKSREQ